MNPYKSPASPSADAPRIAEPSGSPPRTLSQVALTLALMLLLCLNSGLVYVSCYGMLGRAKPEWFLFLTLAWILGSFAGVRYAVGVKGFARWLSIAWFAFWMALGIALNLWCIQSMMIAA